ncbi:MAG: hypothetical protein RLZZ230_604 [Candidatus Parcubacteria bacterium]|jgi:murein tripeptide amidase MpaA
MSRTKTILIGFIFLTVGILVVFKLISTPAPTIDEFMPETPIIRAPEAALIATSTQRIIGTSVENRNIEAYTFGTGSTSLLFVGGIHGGYEWNSILLAYAMIDYLKDNSEVIPENLTIHIIPDLNPDGLFKATGLEGEFSATDIKNNDMHATGIGRFNANNVDLN